MRSFEYLLIAVGALASTVSWADCADPTGIEGKMVYNGQHKVMQFCNGTNWISMASTFASGAWANNGGDDLYFSTGNVGIGTTEPSNSLHVIGEIITASPYPYVFFKESDEADGSNIWSIGGAATSLVFSTRDSNWGASSIKVKIERDGNVGIGTSAPTHLLHVNGVARSTQSSFATSSDRRVKENIHTMENGLSTLAALRPVTFNYTEEYQNGNAALAGLKRGFIAQEVENVLPEMVSQGVEKVGEREIKDFRILNNSDFVPVLVAAVQELAAENTALKKRQAAYEAHNTALEKRLEALESKVK